MYWLILISNADAGCKLSHHDYRCKATVNAHQQLSNTQTIITIFPGLLLQLPGSSSKYRPVGYAVPEFSNESPSHSVKPPSNPAPREHSQTNKHSTAEHRACSATAHPTLASRHMRGRSAATAAARPASDYRAHPVRMGQKGRTAPMVQGMTARLALTGRHPANTQRRCRWLRIGGCVMRWGSRRRMWPAPGGFRVLSPVRMCSAVVDGLVAVVVSQV